MERINRNRAAVALAVFSFVMIAAMAVIFMWEPASPITSRKRGVIGVIEIQGVIEDTEYAGILSAAVREAIEDESIKAVVLEIDSPGGTAYLVEQVYLDLLELGEKKPVVASASMALSGGYYLAVTAEQIYVQPTSMVGNVGVIGVGPGFLVPSEFTFESGPQKITGFSPALFPFNITKALDSFASAVTEGRGIRLNLALSELKRGGVYLGGEAVNQGLVDEIGSRQSAISYAAEQAGLETYTVDSLVARVANTTVTVNLEYPSIGELNKANPPPALYYLYMPRDVVMENGAETPDIALSEQTTGSGFQLMNGPSNTDPDAVLNSKAILYAPYYTQFTGWGTEFTDSVKSLLDKAKKPKFKTTYYKNGAATVDALSGLTGYGLIVFHTHGGVDKNGNILLSTGEVINNASLNKHLLKYLTKQLTSATIHGKTYWCIKPKFISSLNGTFPNSIVYAGACSSSKTKTLSSAFTAKGANTYYGFSETVYGWFDKKMADQVFPKLITENKTTGESFTPGQKDTHVKPAYFTMDGNAKTYFKAGLINGDFEKGNLTGWSKQGDGRVISKLGYINPWEGGFMGIISTGLGYTESSGSISQTFWVDPDNTTLTLKWNFLSEEFMEYVGSQYQDYFEIKVIDEQGKSEVIFRKAIDDIANGYTLKKVSPDIVFDKGDVYGTGWQFFQWSLYPHAGTTVTLELSCGDVGDSIYDTAVLIDLVTDIN